ncbi:hypothetical protein [uncultured Thiohalocapsa sp.]|uniref:hypothetical protein n=1 Tax=uncultured Thiohalocapsa sp. TaxID=768990 RepID=UPI0025F89BAF|nr:hypothetical protein [uncultured Thiohalocapsa sp.]
MTDTHTTAAAADATAPVQITDIYPFRRFVREVWEAQGLGTEHSLRWLVRHRHANGLLACGAIIEKRTPGSGRPLLYIHGPRFAAWLATTDAEAA